MQHMGNPFKFGSVVDGEYFTDRNDELPQVKQIISSRNHLILISPRRYGKTSLIRKAVKETNRPSIFVNVQAATYAADLARLLLNRFFDIHPWERIKDGFKRFRVSPAFTYNPNTNEMEASFKTAKEGGIVLEDVLNLMNEKSDPDNRLIIILDEFQEIANYAPGTDKLLRAVMQMHQNVNYIFLGSEESMMRTMFEDIKSPFFHFGSLMHLSRIPYDDFCRSLSERLTPLCGSRSEEFAHQILDLSKCQPFYTQQLAAGFWDLYERIGEKATVQSAVEAIIRSVSPSYSFVWRKLSMPQRIALQYIARGDKLQDIDAFPLSTVYSAVGRLKKDGLIVREEDYEFEDPFFGLWIRAL